MQWTQGDFYLCVVGDIGVPRQQCGIPLGIKIPVALLSMVPELEAGRNMVEEAFGTRLFDGTRRHRDLQPWLGEHICASACIDGFYCGTLRPLPLKASTVGVSAQISS